MPIGLSSDLGVFAPASHCRPAPEEHRERLICVRPPALFYRISFRRALRQILSNGSEPYMLPEYFPFGSLICGGPKALPRLEPFWGLLWFLPLFIFIIAPNSEKSIVFFNFFIFFYIDCPFRRKSVFFPVYRSAKRAKCRVGNFYR